MHRRCKRHFRGIFHLVFPHDFATKRSRRQIAGIRPPSQDSPDLPGTSRIGVCAGRPHRQAYFLSILYIKMLSRFGILYPSLRPTLNARYGLSHRAAYPAGARRAALGESRTRSDHGTARRSQRKARDGQSHGGGTGANVHDGRSVGHGAGRGTNPCREIVKYRARKRERFLTDGEFRRLGRVLGEAGTRKGVSVHAVAAIRLLLLTRMPEGRDTQPALGRGGSGSRRTPVA